MWRPSRSATAAPPRLRRPHLDLGRALLTRDLVQHTVDIAVALIGAEGLRELHRLVDDHTIRNLRVVHQFIDTDTQDSKLDGIEIFNAAVEERAIMSVQFRELLRHTAQQLAEIGLIGTREVLLREKLALDVAQVLARHLPLIQGLQRTAPRLAAPAAHERPPTQVSTLRRTLISRHPFQQADHLQRGERRLGALVAGFGARALHGLLDGVHREHTEGDGQVVFQRHLCNALRTFASDVIEVRRRAADHATERNHGVETKDIDLFHAPGAFEIPLIAQKAAATKKYDAVTHERIDRAGDVVLD